mmetsp:Transcript_18003/g.20818  ORF Transcript_18003/g.20818 Transcript_18003/m.20818 type:complete len:494 (+) Transcript_18003:423-1904(+)
MAIEAAPKNTATTINASGSTSGSTCTCSSYNTASDKGSTISNSTTDKPPNIIIQPVLEESAAFATGLSAQLGPPPIKIPGDLPSIKVPPNSPSCTVTPVGGGVGRIKAKPVCRIPSLRKEHMTSQQLSKWCFSPTDVWSLNDVNDGNDMNNSTEIEQQQDEVMNTGSMSPNQWATIKRAILNQNESRNGRDHQRFATDALTAQLLRLTTGCVPIMNDGKILLVSSSRKGEWILPKGGWESDESLQGSAMREAYEEGGILGVIGPRLTDINYETRKAKKRRLELETLKKRYEIEYNGVQQQQQNQQKSPNAYTSSALSVQSNASTVEDDQILSGSGHSRDWTCASDTKQSLSPMNKECIATQIRNEITSNGNNLERHDDSASVASFTSYASDMSSSCTHVRMSMFPLYVLEVRENWPESGRARKVVDIDTAIDIMSSRPEFHQVLLEVKKKGYHLKPPSQAVKTNEHENNAHEKNVGTKSVTEAKLPKSKDTII